MAHLEAYYPEIKYGGFTRVDGTIAFFSRVNALLREDFTVLDVGCGRGEYADDPVSFRRSLRVLKGKCKRIIGIDIDPAASSNPYIDVFNLIQGESWPVSDKAIDVCICDHVVEHVANIQSFLSECHRVLKPGGYLCIRTPNAYSYVALASKLISNKYHARVLATVQVRREPEDVFPTLYRCNTRGQMMRSLATSGFSNSVVYAHEAEPSYLNFSRVAFVLGVVHQRLSPDWLKPILFAFARKD